MALALAALMACVGTGVTFAFFSASAGPSNNQITAGTLSLSANRDQGDTVPGPMFYIGPGGGIQPTGPWAPGDTVHRVLQIKNTGSLAGLLKSVRATLEPGSQRYLADKLQVKVTSDSAGNNILLQGTLGQFLDADQVFPTPITINPFPLSLISLHFWVTLPLNADNSYQNTTTVVDFSVYAEQKAHNP
jgi:predicted ribosomally synthesized peptide with SipW-like signal peptide